MDAIIIFRFKICRKDWDRTTGDTRMKQRPRSQLWILVWWIRSTNWSRHKLTTTWGLHWGRKCPREWTPRSQSWSTITRRKLTRRSMHWLWDRFQTMSQHLTLDKQSKSEKALAHTKAHPRLHHLRLLLLFLLSQRALNWSRSLLLISKPWSRVCLTTELRETSRRTYSNHLHLKEIPVQNNTLRRRK